MATIRGKTERVRAATSAVSARGTRWVEQQEATSRRGATIGVARLYKSADMPLYAMLFTAYAFVTVIPATIALASSIYDDPAKIADRLVARLHLSGDTATLVHNVLVGAADHPFTATILAIGNLIIFGSGFGRTLQLIHARAWGVELPASRLRDQDGSFLVLTVFVFIVGAFLAQTVVVGTGRVTYVTAPLWAAIVAGYFVWAPHHLLHRRVAARSLVPGAVLVALGLVALRVSSRIVLANWMNWYAKNYGGFGIVLASYFWLLLVGCVVVVGAALAPPLALRRNLLAAPASPSWVMPRRRGRGIVIAWLTTRSDSLSTTPSRSARRSASTGTRLPSPSSSSARGWRSSSSTAIPTRRRTSPTTTRCSRARSRSPT